MNKSQQISTIQAQWARCLTKAVAPLAGEVQKIETKKAFYAGAFTALNQVRLIGAKTEISEEKGVRILEAMFGEILRYTVEDLLPLHLADKPPSNTNENN